MKNSGTHGEGVVVLHQVILIHVRKTHKSMNHHTFHHTVAPNPSNPSV